MCYRFHPNKELLNVNFQGYKLAEEPLEHIQRELPCSVSAVKLKEGEFSYQHTRAHTLHNHLHSDPSDPSSVYWCGSGGSIMKTSLSEDGCLSMQTVFTLPRTTIERTTNVTIEFVGTHVGVVCAGDNEVAVFSRDSRSGTEKWTVLKSYLLPEGSSANVVCACLGIAETYTDILCAELGKTSHPESIATYKWLRIGFKVNPMLTQPDMEDITDFTIMTAFQSKSFALYTAFQHQPTCAKQQLLFVSETTPLIDTTLTETVKEPQVAAETVEQDSSLIDESILHHGLGYQEEDYQWTQSETDVVIVFQLAPEIHKRDISCVIDPEELVVGLSDGTTLLRGGLAHTIDPGASTWTIQNNILEVTLEKVAEGVVWRSVVKDRSAEQNRHCLPLSEGLEDELSAEELEKVKRILEELAQQKDLGSSPKRACPIMQTQLEECDSSEEDVAMFVISEKCELKQRVDFGRSQFLFAAAGPSRHPGYFSLRHNVDAVVWLPHASLTSSKARWSHVSTFSALGYVQASKSERKFTTCSPNLKYAVISNSSHVFVYMQPKERHDSAVEYVYSAPRQTNILGLVVSDRGNIFVLTSNHLNILKIPHY